MNGLAAFLRDRLADIEQDARDSRALTPGDLHWSMPDWLDRDYLLADIEAKRQIFDWCAEVIGVRDLTRYGEVGSLSDDRDALAVTLAVETLRLLALPHAGHPSYRPEWAPVSRPTCPRCGSPRWVSVSLDGGYTRRAQCVPCGAYHPSVIGPGWKSARFSDPEAEHPDYREVPASRERP